MSEQLAQLEKKGSSGGATFASKLTGATTSTSYVNLPVSYYDSEYFTVSNNVLTAKKSFKLSIHAFSSASFTLAYSYLKGFHNNTQLFSINGDQTMEYQNLNLAISEGDKIYFQQASQNGTKVGAYTILYAH